MVEANRSEPPAELPSTPQRGDAGDAPAPEKRDIYPAGPDGALPPVQATPGYRLRVVLVLASLLSFVALYLALLAASGYLVYLTVVEMRWLPGKGVILNLGAIAGSGMLFLFLLKGLFHSRPFSSEGLVEVTEQDQPRLFAFLRRLCEDAGSRLPGKVYLSHDVNAAVSYPRSLLSLIWPVRKDLVVGLGLVSALDLSELKAVLAHEFGHFSQASMKLGQYVYVANGVVADIVFGRDAWDRALNQWRSVDIRLSFPAWILSGVVWVLRKLLELVFRAINLANLSLARQMEFNADLHAVRLAGSDAIVSGLWKAERAALAYRDALGGLASVAEHGKFSEDVFAHMERSLAQLDARLGKAPDARERFGPILARYEPGPALHFTSPAERVSSLWASHPPNHEREANAKRVYVAAPADRRPAFELFVKRKALRKRMSRVVYEALGYEALGRRPRELLPAEEIAALVEEERGEMRQAEHYHGLYENRVLDPGDIDAGAAALDADAASGALDRGALRAAVLPFTGDALKERMARLDKLRGERDLIEALTADRVRLKGKTADFRGAARSRDGIIALAEEVQRELKAELAALAEADQAFFRHFYACSADDPAARAELVERTRFLVTIQKLVVRHNALEEALDSVCRRLQHGTELNEHEFRRLTGVLDAARSALVETVDATKPLSPPKLALLKRGTLLHRFVLPDGVVAPPPEGGISGAWMNELLQQHAGALGRLRKLHFKNLGQLLALTERLDPALFPAQEPREGAPDERDGNSAAAGREAVGMPQARKEESL
ncbi:M48 family metalloprotease [Sorangium sp. So ce1000]|uniref:M48 family metalloprotease n=1 Tax=Sorangium sp. So ce1000 TaxID=3133325 RepID=UPI003F5E631F